jgi:hypothetical protein
MWGGVEKYQVTRSDKRRISHIEALRDKKVRRVTSWYL